MQVELNDLILYSICPYMQKQGFVLDTQPPAPLTLAITESMLYAYSRQMEVGKPITWQEMLNRWNRTWWKDRDMEDDQSRKECNNGLIVLRQFYDFIKSDQRSPVTINFLYNLDLENHQIEAIVPAVLSENDSPLSLHILLPNRAFTPQELTRQLDIYTHCLMIQQATNRIPTVVEVINITRQLTLRRSSIYPTEAFLNQALVSVLGILNNMQKNIYYPNWQMCPRCSGQDVCFIK